MKKIYDVNKSDIIENPNLELGYLVDDVIIHHIDASPEIPEAGHYEVIATYPNGGEDVEYIIDTEYKPSIPEHDQPEEIYVYKLYTNEELENRELNKLRQLRQTECFSFCDRAVWFYSLSDSEKNDVILWRKKWLDVTDTKDIPEKPECIPNY